MCWACKCGVDSGGSLTDISKFYCTLISLNANLYFIKQNKPTWNFEKRSCQELLSISFWVSTVYQLCINCVSTYTYDVYSTTHTYTAKSGGISLLWKAEVFVEALFFKSCRRERDFLSWVRQEAGESLMLQMDWDSVMLSLKWSENWEVWLTLFCWLKRPRRRHFELTRCPWTLKLGLRMWNAIHSDIEHACASWCWNLMQRGDPAS